MYFSWLNSILIIKKEKEQWKGLLNKLPLGVVVTQNGIIDFYNKECDKIFQESGSTMTQDTFDLIADKTSGETLKEIMKDVNKLQQANNKQLIYDVSDTQQMYFRLRHASIIFRGLDSIAIILQDETAFEELKKLDEKYQRLYLASVVHDIRTPIHGILGMLEFIEAHCQNEEVKHHIIVARNTAHLLIFLTKDITDYSQIEAKTIAINRAYFSPSEAISECLQLLENVVRKNLKLIKFIDDNVPHEIFSDKTRYMQILINLIGNAIKFTPKGEVSVYVRYNELTDILVTQVRDTGVGFKNEDKPKLFKMFSKIERNAEINPTGVGLGLSICKKLSILLGGDIDAESKLDVGSTFTFTIKCGVDRNVLVEVGSPSTFPAGFAEERDSERSALHDSRTFLVRASPLAKKELFSNNKFDQIAVFL